MAEKEYVMPLGQRTRRWIGSAFGSQASRFRFRRALVEWRSIRWKVAWRFAASGKIGDRRRAW